MVLCAASCCMSEEDKPIRAVHLYWRYGSLHLYMDPQADLYRSAKRYNTVIWSCQWCISKKQTLEWYSIVMNEFIPPQFLLLWCNQYTDCIPQLLFLVSHHRSFRKGRVEIAMKHFLFVNVNYTVTTVVEIYKSKFFLNNFLLNKNKINCKIHVYNSGIYWRPIRSRQQHGP